MSDYAGRQPVTRRSQARPAVGERGACRRLAFGHGPAWCAWGSQVSRL